MTSKFNPLDTVFTKNKAAMHPMYGLVQVTELLPDNRRMIKMPNPHPNLGDPQDAFLFVEVSVEALKPVEDPFANAVGLKLAHDANVRGEAGLL
jgi:hypothetical protein